MKAAMARGFYRTSKYRAKRVTVDGVTFDSHREAERYRELQTFVRAGIIRDIERQPAFPCHVAGALVCTYRADFAYEERQPDGRWAKVYEDVKSPVTAKETAYRLRRRLVAALYPEADIREVH